MADLNTDIRFIKGVGETRARALEKLHIRTLGDLISYYPRRWEDRTKLFPIRDLPEGEYACCRAMLAQEPTARPPFPAGGWPSGGGHRRPRLCRRRYTSHPGGGRFCGIPDGKT